MYENGIELESDYRDENDRISTIKIAVLTEPNKESFVVAVASRTDATSSPGAKNKTKGGPSYVWKRLESICNVIRATSYKIALSEKEADVDVDVDEGATTRRYFLAFWSRSARAYASIMRWRGEEA